MSKIRTNVMTKTEIKEALDNIIEMSDEDLKNNCEYIRKIAKESYRQVREMEIKLSISLSKKEKAQFK